MILNFTEQNNLICLEIEKLGNSFFSKNKLHIILGKNNKFHNLICHNSTDIPNFIEKYEEYQKNKYDFQIFFCYQFEGSSHIITSLQQIIPGNFLKFISLNIFWYLILVNDKTQEENILENLEENLSVEIIFKEENRTESNNYSDIEQEINNMTDEIETWKEELKTKNLGDLMLEKKYMMHKFQQLTENISETQANFDTLNNIIKKNSLTISKNALDSKNNVMTQRKKNTLYKTQSENYQKYEKNLQELILIIQKTEQSKNSKIEQLNQVSEILYQKKDQMKKIEYQLAKLENFVYEREKQKNFLEIQNFKTQAEQKKIQNELSQIKKTYRETKNELGKKSNNPKPTEYEMENLAVMLHLYNFSLFEEINNYLQNFKTLGVEFDLYVNLAIDPNIPEIKNKIKNIKHQIEKQHHSKNLYFTYSENKGLDVGGFFKSYIKMLEIQKNYYSIIKIHTKTNNNWRFVMLYALLGNLNIIKKNLKLIRNSQVGMIGFESSNIQDYTNKFVRKLIYEYINRFQVKAINGNFIPGTIFWIKGSVLSHYFNLQNLNISYQEYLPNYCGSKIRKREGRPHAFERFFGILVEDRGLKTVKYDIDSSTLSN